MATYRIILKGPTGIINTNVKSDTPPEYVKFAIPQENNTQWPRMLKVGNSFFNAGDVVGWVPDADHDGGNV